MKNHTKSSNIILMICVIAMFVLAAVLKLGISAFAIDNDAQSVSLTQSATAVFDGARSMEDEYDYDRKELIVLMGECQSTMEAAHTMADAARALGYEESHAVIELATEEYERATAEYEYYKQLYDDIMAAWEARANEYSTATYVWLYFSDLGYSDTVIAGIVGNMMVECGGHSLDLQFNIYSADGYFGLCQWSSGYQSNMSGKDLESQCEFLANTIQREFDTYGHLYKRGFDYSSFMSLTNEKEAAVAFARVYERCGLVSYGARRTCATTAYDYFVE